MKIIKTIVYLFIFVLPLTIVAQNINRHVCGTDEYYRELCKKDPSILVHQQEAENLLLLQNTQMEGLATVNIIPVVFHIIHTNGSENISDSYIQAQIKRLNEDYSKTNSDISKVRTPFKTLAANLGIEFRLARIDPQGNCTNGITRYYSDLTVNADDPVKSLPGQYWDNKKYLNIWVVSSINSSGSVGTVLGRSAFPWMAASSPLYDGILVRADWVGYDKRTLTHEIGHYLGLYHTFQNGDYGTETACMNNDCYKNGDKVCDTPPVADMNFGCDQLVNTCHTETPDKLDMIENYMDYTDCTYMFTTGQSTRVQGMISNFRSTLYSAANLLATGVADLNNINCKVVANFTADEYNVCVGTPVNFVNTSYTSTNAQYIWEFSGGTPPVSFQKNQSVTYSTAGKYDVKLLVKNTLGKDSIIKKQAVVIYPQKGYNLPFYESFESANLTNNLWISSSPLNNIVWARSSKTAATGSYSYCVNNFETSRIEDTISFTLPPINLTGITAPLLVFKHAFAAKTSTHTDKLKIFVSDDCGVTWLPRYTRSPIQLPTTTTLYPTEFIPNNPALWVYNSIDLAFFQNKPNVLIRFNFTTGLGNNLYIDDIRVGIVTDIEKKAFTADNIMIYPNPASKYLSLKFPAIQDNDYEISIHDLLGNELFAKNITANQDNIASINLQDAGILKSGTYLIRIVSKNNIITKIFSVTE